MNKNISVWRGTQSPPTLNHVWIKPDNVIYLFKDGKWQVAASYDFTKEQLEILNPLLKKMDNIYQGNKPLVTPIINGEWKFYNQQDEEVNLSGTIEYGYKAQFIGTYKWQEQEGYKNPTQVMVGSNWNILTNSGEDSNIYTSEQFTETAVVQVGLQAPKTGLMVSGTNVQPAVGLDTTKASTFVYFNHRKYFGNCNTNNPTEADIKKLMSELSESRVSARTVSATGYYIYAYPQSLGDLTKITQDGAIPILGAFTKKTLDITNAAGLRITLNVYISNNPGAFTNNSLKFE